MIIREVNQIRNSVRQIFMKTIFSTLFILALSFTNVHAAGVSYEYDELNRLTKVIYDD